MIKRGFYLVVVLLCSFLNAQEVTKHTVVEGETVSKIAQKYKITPFDIYKLNPDAQTGAKPGMVLMIPKSVATNSSETKPVETKPVETKPVATKPAETKPVVVKSAETKPIVKSTSQPTHTVKAKESLYGISKQYNISIDELEKNNPVLKEVGLQPGQVLVIKKGANATKPAPVIKPSTQIVSSSGIITHQVQPKETKYGIATKYGITVEELERQNPDVVTNLPIGFVLKINKNTVKQAPQSASLEPVKPKEETVSKPLFDYVVKDGDTFYSLTKSADVTQDQLVQMNPELSDGLREGMTIKIPVDLSIARSVTKSTSDLTATLSKKNKKHLVLMIPFNVAKIEMDSLKSLNSKFKGDKFLNMTLDFYSGALMAIDSAKTLGLNVDVSIFDSEETKNTTSAIATLEEKAPDASAVIGPFFQANVEKVAAALEGKNTPVISPLSKDVLKSNNNLFNSMPSEELQKKAIFDYMKSKNGNIIAMVEPEKAEVAQFIKSNYSNVQWVGLSAKNTFVSDSIKKHLVKNKTNFVVMESEKYYTIQTTISTLLAAMKDFTVQLVVIEPNKMLDFEEISLNNLIKLKLTYPSLSKENDTPNGIQFEKEYRRINKVAPNQFAIRGFDVTFDALLRLSQETSFEETAQATASEQVESKFDYAKNANGGYQNKGVYILTYQPDLTIKQAQ